MATTKFHLETSQRLIRQAEDELQRGDSLQASEKAWGAAAHAVKAAAEQRGWRHDSHARLFSIIQRLANQMGESEIRGIFNTASLMHKNFYEGDLEDESIENGIELVKRLLPKLNPVA